MGNKQNYLGEFEEIVLLAVQHLRNNAYGVTIRQAVEEVADRQTSIGAIYTTLDRLEEKGLIKPRMGEATPERGGRAKRYFDLTGEGSKALDETELMRARLRASVGGGGVGWANS